MTGEVCSSKDSCGLIFTKCMAVLHQSVVRELCVDWVTDIGLIHLADSFVFLFCFVCFFCSPVDMATFDTDICG